MSRRSNAARGRASGATACLFAALGDETRLLLVGRLCRGGSQSIAQLTEGSSLTRQAVTKHLVTLREASLVHGERRGREMLFEFTPRPIEEACKYLGQVSAQWDEALRRLKSFVEGP